MTNPSQRALDVLIREDPEFLALSEMLYGDPAYATEYLSKREQPEEKDPLAEPPAWKRNVALGTNAAGSVLGPAAIATAYRGRAGGGMPRSLMRLSGKLKPNNPAARAAEALNKPGKSSRPGRNSKLAAAAGAGLVGGQVLNWGGDMIAAQEMNRQRKVANRKAAQVKAQGVNKALPGVDDLVGGILNSQGVKQAKHAKPPKKAETLGGALHAPLEHKKATGIVLGTGYLAHRRGKKKGQQEGFQAGYYAKRDKVEKPMPDLEIAGTFSKFDDEKRQAFGYASVVKKDGMPVIDRQGDYIDADEMEKAAYQYVKKSRIGGDMHRRTRDEYGIDKAHHVSDLIESMVFTPEKCKAMGLPDEVAKKLDGHWWVGYQIHDDETWDQVRKQGRTGFSIHGRGKRVDTTVDKIVGY